MEVYNYSNPLNLVVSILIVSIGVFGIACNVGYAFIFLKEKSEKTAFNTICFFRAISNTIILTNVFLITFLPKTLLGFSHFPPVVESWLINISNTFYLGNEYQIILVALNRFCALFFPFQYSKIFSVTKTTIVLVAIYIYRIGIKIYEWAPESAKGCHALFYTDRLAWYYDDSPHCDFVDNAPEFIFWTFVVISVVNSITFVKILVFFKTRSDVKLDRESKLRIRSNIVQFVQTIVQDSLYLIDMTFTFKLSSWSTNRVWTYFSGTFIWECLHSIDGFIMILFNKRILFSGKKKNINSSVVKFTATHQTRPHSNSICPITN